MSMSMRPAEKKDVKAICNLMQQLRHTFVSSEQMLNRLKMVQESRIDSLYLCEEAGEIIGLIGFRVRENIEEVSRYGEVSVVVVRSDRRLHGIGRYMMDYASNLAEERGCKGVWLVSGFGAEEESHDFYKKLGFESTGYRFVKLFA